MPVTIMNTTKMRILKEIGLFWLSWFELYKVLDKYSKNNIPKGEFLIVNDLIEFLKKRSMTKFNGFKIDDVEKAWNYNNKNKYNFSDRILEKKRLLATLHG